MSRLKSGWQILAASILALVAFRATTMGQTTTTGPETLSALLVEVRGLRAAMEQMASAGPRVQLAIGRLQLQEQRVNTLVRRADALQETIGTKQRELTGLTDRVSSLETQLERNVQSPDMHRQLEFELAQTRKESTRAAAELQRLQAEESDAAAQVTNEQARWVEINQRLEELERSLERR